MLFQISLYAFSNCNILEKAKICRIIKYIWYAMHVRQDMVMIDDARYLDHS